MRPTPYEGVRVTCKKYRNKQDFFKDDLLDLVIKLNESYKKDFRYVLALSGGIDSEVTAEAFYSLGIPFRVVILNLFNNRNLFDSIYAYKYCVDNKIPYKIITLSEDHFIKYTLPKAVELGQFSHSLSQAALTYLFDFISEDEILIFSGHNPDFNPKFGFGWWEDIPNLIKYAINNKFFTFTSLEPIFLHYAMNYSKHEPGNKNNDFLYEAFPTLRKRIKRTGWEACLDIHKEYFRLLDKPTWKNTNEKVQVFIGWK